MVLTLITDGGGGQDKNIFKNVIDHLQVCGAHKKNTFV